MADTDTLTFRALEPRDVDGACALNAEAGWNQVAADWRYIIDAGEGVAVEDADGALIASGMVLPYGGAFAWIAMILVTKQWRQRGLATEIMHCCIETCERLGVTAGLDATEQGRPVYLPLGFRDIYPLSRMTAVQVDVGLSTTSAVRPATAADLAAIAAFDAATSGADRQPMLTHLLARAPHLAFLAEEAGRVRGFVLGRDGRLATQVGPLQADDPEIADTLLTTALSGMDGPVFLDVADRHEAMRSRLEALGFQRQRGYARMLIGRVEPFDTPERSFVIAGPELG